MALILWWSGFLFFSQRLSEVQEVPCKIAPKDTEYSAPSNIYLAVVNVFQDMMQTSKTMHIARLPNRSSLPSLNPEGHGSGKGHVTVQRRPTADSY